MYTLKSLPACLGTMLSMIVLLQYVDLCIMHVHGYHGNSAPACDEVLSTNDFTANAAFSKSSPESFYEK